VFLKRRQSNLIIVFNVKVSNPSALGIKLSAGNLEFSSWSNPWNASTSKLWTISALPDVDTLTLSSKLLTEEFGLDEICVSPDSSFNHFPVYFDDETKVFEGYLILNNVS